MTYYPKITHTEAWAQTEAGKKIATPAMLENFEKKLQKIELTLTGNGWVVQTGN